MESLLCVWRQVSVFECRWYWLFLKLNKGNTCSIMCSSGSWKEKSNVISKNIILQVQKSEILLWDYVHVPTIESRCVGSCISKILASHNTFPQIFSSINLNYIICLHSSRIMVTMCCVKCEFRIWWGVKVYYLTWFLNKTFYLGYFCRHSWVYHMAHTCPYVFIDFVHLYFQFKAIHPTIIF